MPTKGEITKAAALAGGKGMSFDPSGPHHNQMVPTATVRLNLANPSVCEGMRK